MSTQFFFYHDAQWIAIEYNKEFAPGQDKAKQYTQNKESWRVKFLGTMSVLGL